VRYEEKNREATEHAVALGYEMIVPRLDWFTSEITAPIGGFHQG